MSEVTSLQKIDQARQWLAEAKSLDDILHIRDIAEAARTYAKAAKVGLGAQNNAAAIKIEAECKAGEFLAAMEKAPAGRPNGNRFQHGTDFRPPTYAEMDIAKATAHRWQLMASVPTEQRVEFVDRVMAAEEELTSQAVYRIAKEMKRQAERDANAELARSTPPASVAVGESRFQTIVLDPPWDWGDEGDADQLGRARPTYATMPLDQLMGLPVGDLAAEDCHLYLWITNRSLPKGFCLLDTWGFRHITMLTWCKPHYGMGNYFRGSTEQVLFGVRGSLPLLRHDVGTWFEADRQARHSGKPAEFYRLVETCSPGPWLEMFAREQRPGWATWGAEV